MRYLFTFWLLIIADFYFSQNPTFNWVDQFGGTGSDQGRGIVSDASGNIYTTGYFESTVDFDPSAAVANLVSSGGIEHAYITKYNSLGQYQWAFKLDGGNEDQGLSIAIDGSSNIYVTGFFSSTVDFDPGAGTATLTSNGGNDIFVAKYNSSGVYQWAISVGSVNNDEGYGISLDAANNVYVTGRFCGIADFDPSASVSTVSNSALADFFVAKYSSSGNYQWAFGVGGAAGPGINCSFGIKSDATGNTYVTGYFSAIADFNPSASTNTLSAVGTIDAFVAKYNSSGQYQWAIGMGGLNNDQGNAIAIDGSGNCYVSGNFFSSSMDMDPSASTSVIANAGTSDIFVAKYNSTGSLQWAFPLGSTSSDVGSAIETDGGGNCYVSGYFNSVVDFDPSAVTSTLSSTGSNIFVANYNSSGQYNFGFNISGANGYGRSILLGQSNSLHLTGSFGGNADFDPSPSTSTITSVALVDAYLAKYTLFCQTPTSPTNNTSSSNQTICAANTTTLNATSTGTINWFTTPTGTVSIGSGTNYITPTLSAGTYTYYAEAQTCTVSASRTPITVTVNPTPTITVNSGSICSGQNFTIVPSGANSYTIQGGNTVVSPTATTSYTVAGTSTAGCVSSSQAICNVSVGPLPTVSVSTSNTLICQGITATLTASGGTSYTFNPGGAGANIVVSPSISTSYTVTGTGSNGCQNTAIITQSVSTCSGIIDVASSVAELVVYPNPSQSGFTIRSSDDNNIQIFDQLGKLVQTVELNSSNNYNSKVSDMQSGVYFAKNKHKTIKIVVLE